ncbi:DSPc domain-containing protein/Myb_DNA-bind_3 domain-containing protein [Cephalotus follicularis]|uniref:DSPc domain-containing protein/Myb_DNA-bind_3 domain-containing protein n=1 Tax=Cephalotus follicularis TaxID=3775 RepID=A0A1Q3AYW4_CEPFO|nr:DSPc domain-containing protein/Myb_DNA-bind_3 domain-containing protein [Cephalotus follicularis]
MAQTEDAIQDQVSALLRAFSVTKYIKEDKVPCQIEQGLFLGSVGAANNKDELKRLNVTHILTVANSLVPMHPNDFVYKVVEVSDREDTNLRQHFDECFGFIDETRRQGAGVLVHCFAGRSRSVTIIVAYLMKRHGMSLSQSLEHVRNRRPRASPNSGFICQLQEFEKSLQGLSGKNWSEKCVVFIDSSSNKSLHYRSNPYLAASRILDTRSHRCVTVSSKNMVKNKIMAAANEPVEKAMWEPHIVNIFCDICIKEIDNGGKPKSHFTKEAWKSLVETFGRETGRAYDYNKLKNKWDQLKKDYLLWRALLGADTGFGWDSEKRTVDASDDWWKRRIAENDKVKKFRTRGIHPELEDKLRTMFSSVVAYGGFAYAPSSCANHTGDVNALEGSGDSQDSDLNVSGEDIDITQAPYQVADSEGRMRKADIGVSYSRLKKGKKKAREKVGGATKMAAQIDRLIMIIESQVRSDPTVDNSNCSISMVINMLDNLEDIIRGSELYMFATKLFCVKEKREMFFALGEDLRALWIRSEFASRGI